MYAFVNNDLSFRCNELANAFTEDSVVLVDVLSSQSRTAQRHVVEGSEQHAAVQHVKVNIGLQREVTSLVSLAAVSRRSVPEEILGSGSNPGNVPGELGLLDGGLDSFLKSLRQLGHVFVVRFGHGVLEGGLHRRKGRRIASQSATEAEVVHLSADLLAWQGAPDLLGGFLRDSVDAAGDATSNALAQDEDVRLKVVGSSVASRGGGDGVGLIDDQEGAVLPREISEGLVETWLSGDHADVGHDRLGKHASDVLFGQRGFEGGDVVELDADGDVAVVNTVLMNPGLDPRDGLRVHRPLHVSLVHGAVIAVAEAEDLGPLGGHACQSDAGPVGLGG